MIIIFCPTSHFLHHPTEIQTQCPPSNMERGDKSHQNSPEYSSLRPTIDLWLWWPSTHLLTRRSRASSHDYGHPDHYSTMKHSCAGCTPSLDAFTMMWGGDRRCWWVVMGGFGCHRWTTKAIERWIFAFCPLWRSQLLPLTSSWPPEQASIPLWCVQNDFPSGLASDGLWKVLHHNYALRSRSNTNLKGRFPTFKFALKLRPYGSQQHLT
jgi:hypothetical protein